jgi:hypothetical protein
MKAQKRLKKKINALLFRGNPTPWPELQTRLNRLLLGWAEYFSFGFTGQADTAIRWHVIQRVRQFLCRRHKLRVSGTSRFGPRRSLLKSRSNRPPPSVPETKTRACPLVKSVREPDAGDPQVRFDKRRWETELRPRLRHRHQGEAAGNSYSLDLQPPPAVDSTLFPWNSDLPASIHRCRRAGPLNLTTLTMTRVQTTIFIVSETKSPERHVLEKKV